MSSLFCRTPCCGPIHGLHLCDNFGAFNVNIEDFIGKNSEKMTKNNPSFSYIKVKNPENWIGYIFWTILIFRKKHWNHSNEFFKISLTCFFDPGPPPIAFTSVFLEIYCSKSANFGFGERYWCDLFIVILVIFFVT